jgi:hypothetical protein
MLIDVMVAHGNIFNFKPQECHFHGMNIAKHVMAIMFAMI